MVGLRPATIADAPSIKHMVRQAKLNPFGLDWQRFTVAVQGESEVIGCVQAKPHGDEVMELASLVVLPAWRGRGIARLLIRSLQERHAPPVWLMCRAELARFYEQFSFRLISDVDRLPAYFRRIHRLAQIFGLLIPDNRKLAIMVWTADHYSLG